MGKDRIDSKGRSFGYEPVAVLMGVCLIVMAAIVLALVSGASSDIQSEKQDDVNIEETMTDGNAESMLTEAVQDESTSGQISQEAGTAEGSENAEETASEEAAAESRVQDDTEPEAYEFTVSDKAYFDDALFIGDSRTMGLKTYGIFDNADYFASPGLSLYSIDSTMVEVIEGKKIKLEELLDENTYGKVYIMLGINELGYDYDTTIKKYGEFLDYITSLQPDAILYVCANMHVNSLRNELDEIHNNAAINRINEQISTFADQENIFYLDVNPMFDDENGNLAQEYISDDTHLMGIYYETWCEWYAQNTIVK